MSGADHTSDSQCKSDETYTVIASAKRTPTNVADEGGREDKRVKTAEKEEMLAPLFRRTMQSSAAAVTASSSSSSSSSANQFVWHTALGPNMSCLCGVYGKPFERAIEAQRETQTRVKVACFDLDGCIVKPKNGRTWPSASDPYDFEQAFRGSLGRIKKEYEQNGACIAIISNQFQNDLRSKKIGTWKDKMKNIAHAIDCPLIVFAALTRDGFRKPGRMIWDAGLVEKYVEAGGKRDDLVDHRNAPINPDSFFVGDAAGRVGDHSDTDRKWATNVGLRFFTPEEFFLGSKPKKYSLSGWQPTIVDLEEDGVTLPSNFFTNMPEQHTDLVLFVGAPASGKTSFFQKHFAGRDYVWVNQDTLRTSARCLAEAKRSLEDGKSIVVDNTNRNVSTRAPYIALAKSMPNAQVRCIFFDVPEELCRHNNFFRVRAGLQPAQEPRQLLPDVAFSSFFQSLERPEKEEGFDADIVTVKWIFQGDEEAKRRWLMRWD